MIEQFLSDFRIPGSHGEPYRLAVESHERSLLTTALRGNYTSPDGRGHRVPHTHAKIYATNARSRN